MQNSPRYIMSILTQLNIVAVHNHRKYQRKILGIDAPSLMNLSPATPPYSVFSVADFNWTLWLVSCLGQDFSIVTLSPNKKSVHFVRLVVTLQRPFTSASHPDQLNKFEANSMFVHFFSSRLIIQICSNQYIFVQFFSSRLITSITYLYQTVCLRTLCGFTTQTYNSLHYTSASLQINSIQTSV